MMTNATADFEEFDKKITGYQYGHHCKDVKCKSPETQNYLSANI